MHYLTNRLHRSQAIFLCLFLCLFLWLSFPCKAADANDALYHSLGQEAGITRIVERLLLHIQADTRINHSFKDSNMKRLAKLLEEQFCALSGGPCIYSGDDMQLTHEKLGIRSAQFNALVEDLQNAMDDLNIATHTQNRLIARLAVMKTQIVNNPHSR